MSNVYQEIATLDSNEERAALRTFFTQNPEKRAEAELILPTCGNNKEVVAYFKDLLKSGMFSLSRVIFANNTEYLLILVLFFPASYRQTRPKKHIRVIVDQPAVALGKRKAVEDLSYPNLRPYPDVKKWTVNGVISPKDRAGYYYADPAETNDNFVARILKGEFVALHGPRASGKTTRVYRTMQQLASEYNCHCFYITLQNVNIADTNRFWVDIGKSLQRYNDAFFNCSETVNTGREFSDAFNKWKFVVIFVDEFDRLYNATNGILNSFLDCIRDMKHAAKSNKDYPILSVVAVGTFGILNLNSSDTYSSPFNVQEPLQNPNLSKDQVQSLFEDFELDQKIKIDPKIIEDIYLQTNGHASMVCLCGDLIEKTKTSDFTLESWKSLVFTSLSKSIHGYRTFNRIVDDLLKNEARSAVDLLRLEFLPNPGPVTITNTQDLVQAHYLARNGVLIIVENEADTFTMSSPLLRSVILRYVLPDIFKYCPSIAIPRRSDGSIDTLSALRHAVCVFDKNNIKLASDHSYKTALVSVGKCHNVLVPRESVYQQQLAGIFTNWISSLKFEIMSQYHITEGKTHRYSDLIITAPSTHSNRPTVILELLATSTKKQLEEHFDRTLKYAQSLTKKLFVRDFWVVHFTRQDNPNCWPSNNQRKKGLNAVIFWHNLDFTKVYMSARYNGGRGELLVINKEYIIGTEV